MLVRLLDGWELRFYYRRSAPDKRDHHQKPRCFLERAGKLKHVSESVFCDLRERGLLQQIESRPDYSVWDLQREQSWKPPKQER